MTQVGFSGSGTAQIRDDQINIGQGLQVGNTLIDCSTGKIKRDNGNVSGLIGSFRTFKKQSKESDLVKTFVFKAKTKCIIKYQKTSIEYNLINEWIILNGISTDKIEVERSATNIATDVFDWNFIISDDPNFKISIEKGTRDSDFETLFVNQSRAIETYTKNFNVQGASKIILTGKSTSGSGTASISLEIFDPSSNDWFELIPVEGIFALAGVQKKLAQIGDSISRIQEPTNPFYSQNTTNSSSIHDNWEYVRQGFILPSGDNILRAKAIITTNSLTFSLGVTKVFN